jgi:hypothetical protein
MSIYVMKYGRVFDLSFREFLIDPEVTSKGTYKVMYDHNNRIEWTNDAHTYIQSFNINRNL